MINTIIASAALLATSVVAQGVGRAIVVNACDFPVNLINVPAEGGGQSQVGPQSLNTGASYSQQFTPLSNGNGWSMKLTTGGSAGLLQYEYTFQNDGVIWFDLSAVNGDPFGGNWGLSATGACDPKNTAYRFPTDDTYGMQSSCPQDSSVTVTLCGNGAAAAPAPGAGAPSGAPAAPSAAAPDPHRVAPSVPASAPPAAVPSVAAPDDGRDHHHDAGVSGFQQLNAATVTNVKTTVVTHYVTVSPSPVQKREEHLHRHMNRHNH